MKLEKYSMGVGDRFGHQGASQLSAMQKALDAGIEIVPVWNKSYREHSIIGTNPNNARFAADEAVKKLGWKRSYYVDADHIGLKTVDLFIASSNFYTLDVADYIGIAPEPDAVEKFVGSMSQFLGTLIIPGIEQDISVTKETLRAIGKKFLVGIREAGNIYRHIEKVKGSDNFITEVSMDETDQPQNPVELFFILAGLAAEKIPLQTIAPKFTGKFLKGVDYVGDAGKFTREFEEDLAVIAYAVNIFHLPKNLKLSVHSGSDKFSIYPAIHRAIKKADAGLHLKTAGTTWLEELIGLAMAGGEGLLIAKEVYRIAIGRFDELCKPYHTVIEIDRSHLPDADTVQQWNAEQYANALRHVQSNPQYNRNFRQLLHVGYKVAAEMGKRYIQALEKNSEIIGANVAENLFDRHVKPIFLGK